MPQESLLLDLWSMYHQQRDLLESHAKDLMIILTQPNVMSPVNVTEAPVQESLTPKPKWIQATHNLMKSWSMWSSMYQAYKHYKLSTVTVDEAGFLQRKLCSIQIYWGRLEA